MRGARSCEFGTSIYLHSKTFRGRRRGRERYLKRGTGARPGFDDGPVKMAG